MEKQPSQSNREKRSLAKKSVIVVVRFYQAVISPWLGPGCRYQPTCSEYMIGAIEEWGVLKGAWMGIRRLSRCHPWGGEGYDPVPEKSAEGSADESENM